MPHTKSAKKRLRQQQKRRLRNRAVKHRVKTLVKKAKKLLDEGKIEEAKIAFNEAYSAIDKAVKYGVFHKNKASNYKSKLANYFNKKLSKINS